MFATGGCQMEGPYFIPGTGTLPDCNEAPITNLDGACWFDSGVVTIRSAGCQEAVPNDMFTTCGLGWSFTQVDNDVTIVVDGEYRIDGKLCGDQLHLLGGWWLLVEDAGMCDYQDEESADEVSIQAEGNVLTFVPISDPDTDPNPQMTGTLAVQGSCSADYDVVLRPGGSCFF
ncbi:MAG: hypothetical protein JRD92_19385 [Deltaproteobacteria bacterium]|nr:hypothetical protein [Deltaproteobacteria bacterium]